MPICRAITDWARSVS